MNTDTTATDTPFRCNYPGCDRSFPEHRGLTMHRVRAHRKHWVSTKPKHIPPSATKERKREYYLRHKQKMLSKGLNAHGAPYKRQPESLLNGVAPEPTDNMAESARAIIMAAQVLRSVAIGMKL